MIVQCDTQNESFVLAADIDTGATVWKTVRNELPSWGRRPCIRLRAATRRADHECVELHPRLRPDTGAERWRLGGSSKITAPTPVFTRDLIVIASGRAPERPVFAIKPGATGDITLGPTRPRVGTCCGARTGRGSYMPTPLIYDGVLYVLANQGLLDAYDLQSGNDVYRQRIPHSGSGFSASPVAADGRIYLSSEDGDIFVVRAGPRSGSSAATRWASR